MTRSLADTTRAFAAHGPRAGRHDHRRCTTRSTPITCGGRSRPSAAGVPGIAGDPTWNPLTPTAADPSYPGAHSALSAAAATALGAVWGDRQTVAVTSAADPGVTRSFTSLAAVADEAGAQPHLGGPAHPHRRRGGPAARPPGGGRGAGRRCRWPPPPEHAAHDRVAAPGGRRRGRGVTRSPMQGVVRRGGDCGSGPLAPSGGVHVAPAPVPPVRRPGGDADGPAVGARSGRSPCARRWRGCARSASSPTPPS